jgi:hypothetical protein
MLNNMKSTRGPWIIKPSGRNLKYPDKWLICPTRLKGKYIAIVDNDPDDVNCEADAYLIAAAPSLLKACKEAEIVLKEQNNGNCLASILSAIREAEFK